MRGLVDRLGQIGASAAALSVALGTCAIGASIFVPADLGSAADWTLAIGVIVIGAGLAYLAVFYDHRANPPR